MIAFISREYGEKQTLGHFCLFNGNNLLFNCFTLEPQWNDNKKSNSCVPERRYKAKKHNSPKYGECLMIMDVAGRELILIHWGNYRDNTEGCILVGLSISDINGDGLTDVMSSRKAFDKLMSIIDKEFDIIIASDIK